MALEQRLSDSGTVARIEGLVTAGKLTAAMGADLTESLYFFMGLKLKVGLAELGHEPPGFRGHPGIEAEQPGS